VVKHGGVKTDTGGFIIVPMKLNAVGSINTGNLAPVFITEESYKHWLI
jgi:hypothetical protein